MNESRTEYARVVAELAVHPTPADPDPGAPGRRDLRVNELLLGFWDFADRYYRRADGTPTNELPQFRQTFRLVRALYGHTPAREFGPLALKAVRQKMIETGWNRKLVNQRVGLEVAQVALGHERADVTQVYAERNLALAVQVAAEIG